jgi:hypothetical protein
LRDELASRLCQLPHAALGRRRRAHAGRHRAGGALGVPHAAADEGPVR